jgi:C-terminal processing protease CtpA/Prc
MEQTIFNIALGLAAFSGGWVLTLLWAAIRELSNAVREIRRDVAFLSSNISKNYTRREEFREFVGHTREDAAAFKADMKGEFARLGDTLTVYFQKLDSHGSNNTCK